MIKILRFLLLLFVAFASSEISAQNVFSGEPVQYVGRNNTYTAVPNASPDYRTHGFRRVSVTAGAPTDGRGQWKATINVQSSGGNVTPDNMPGGATAGFLLISGPDVNHFQNKWAFGGVGQAAIDGINAATFNGSTDMGLNMSTVGYYTFVLRDAGYVNSNYYVGYTAANPVTMTHSGAAQRTVNGTGSVNVSFTLSATPSAQENFYVRYRGNTNDFSTGTSLVQATVVGTTATATIPVMAGSSTVHYYVFSSTRTLAQLNANTETERFLAHLNYADNSGNNFSYANNVLVTGTTPATSALYSSVSRAGDAFAQINAGTHQGVVGITVLADVTNEDGTISLLASGGTSSYSSVTLSPNGNRLLQGSVATQMIDINGADFVTINGLNAGGNSLIIDNTSNAASNGTVRFINDARDNTITNCTLKGSSTQVNAGVIFFSSSSAANQGNDNIVISNNIIRESSTGDARNGIVSFGSSGAPTTKFNSNNTVSNNQFINCFYAGVASGTDISTGIHLTNAANDSWTITGNSFYWTNSKTSLTSFDYWYGIRITGNNGTGFVITNNFIGGTAPSCGGTAMSLTNTANGNKIVGIDLGISSAVGSASVQGNTIANIFLGTNSSKATAPYVFSGIIVEGGNANIGTTTGNTIGSSTTNNSITVSLISNSSGVFTGIASATLSTIENNSIGGLTASNPSSINARMNIYGIYLTGSVNWSVNNNLIGSNSSPNSILNTTGNTSTAGYITAGINQSAGNNAQFRNNTISNISYSGGGTSHIVAGMLLQNGLVRPTVNTIKNIFTNSPNVGTGAGSSIFGIVRTGTAIGTGDSIAYNTIYNVANTNAGAGAYSVAAIEITSSSSGTDRVFGNLVYDIRTASSSLSSVVDGIRVYNHPTVIANNMVCLGNGITLAPEINGINVQGGTAFVYFNSVAISASATGNGVTRCVNFTGAVSGSACLNNIFYNTRTSSSPTTYTCIYFNDATQFGNVVPCNYNDLYTASGNVVAVVSSSSFATLASWQGSGKDVNSVNFQPVFVNVVNDLHISSGCDLAKIGTPLTITIDFDQQTRSSPPDLGADEYSATPSGVTWTGAVNSNWHVAGNWCPAVVPTSTIDANIPNTAVPNQPLIDLGGNAVCKNLYIGTGKTLTMASSRLLQVYGTWTNNGTFNAGGTSETVEFTATTNITGTTPTTFNNCIINNSTTINVGLQPTIVGIFTLNSGSSVTNPPIYGASSRLNYNTGGSYNVNQEWTGATITAGLGNPNDVSLSNSTTLNMPIAARGLAGTIYITSGTLQMNGTFGADLYVGRDWQRTSGTGFFNPNNRAISFKGVVDQIVRVMGNGTEVFNYLIIDKPNALFFLKPSNVAGALTNIIVNGTSGDVFQIINLGSLDLNGRTFSLDQNNVAASAGNIYVNGNRIITNSAGIGSGLFSITGTNNVNQPNYYTKSVRNNSGTGSLTFDQNVLVTIADGHMDFGFDGTNNLTTIQGVLQVNLGGNVFPNSCYYSGPAPASILRFANTVDYQVSATDKTWAAGAIYSGIPGIPWNVEVNNSGTDLTINDQRSLRNDLTITDGTMTLNAGPFNIGGNWKRQGATSAFVPKIYRVVFDKTGAGNQTIECTNNGNRETYYELEISPATVNVQSLANTDVSVTNQLVFTSGLYVTGAREIYVTNPSATAITGHSLTGYVWGFLKRKIGTGLISYDFPVGDDPSIHGYELLNLNYTTTPGANFTVKSNFNSWPAAIPNGPVSSECVYANYSLFPAFDHGYWTMNNDSGSATGIYTMTLFNRSYTNSAGSLMWSIMKSPTAAFTWSLNGVCDPSSLPSATKRLNMSGFSDFATVQFNSPLPVELISFDAIKINDNDVLAKWETASELNNDFFILESATQNQLQNGDGWQAIAQIDGAGTTTTNQYYNFTDTRPGKKGLYYYRLKQVDFDGQSSYSDTRVVSFTSGKSIVIIGVIPNPFTQVPAFAFDARRDGQIQITITDAIGQSISHSAYSALEGFNKVELNAFEKLSAGIYFLTVESDNEKQTIKVVKQ